MPPSDKVRPIRPEKPPNPDRLVGHTISATLRQITPGTAAYAAMTGLSFIEALAAAGVEDPCVSLNRDGSGWLYIPYTPTNQRLTKGDWAMLLNLLGAHRLSNIDHGRSEPIDVSNGAPKEPLPGKLWRDIAIEITDQFRNFTKFGALQKLHLEMSATEAPGEGPYDQPIDFNPPPSSSEVETEGEGRDEENKNPTKH